MENYDAAEAENVDESNIALRIDCLPAPATGFGFFISHLAAHYRMDAAGEDFQCSGDEPGLEFRRQMPESMPANLTKQCGPVLAWVPFDRTWHAIEDTFRCSARAHIVRLASPSCPSQFKFMGRFAPKISAKLLILLVGAAGFEPTTCSTQNCRATRLRYTPMFSMALSIHAHRVGSKAP
jgi:hypothetical protein